MIKQCLQAGASVRLARSVIFLVCLLGELFAFYWYANEITLQSAAVGDSVARSNWYKFPKPVEKALGLILLMSQKPCNLYVGRFYKMSLDTFVMVNW